MMRTQTFRFAWSMAVVVATTAACSDDVSFADDGGGAAPTGGAGGAGSGNQGSGGEPAGGAGAGAAGGTGGSVGEGGAVGVDCDQLFLDIREALGEAQSCNPLIDAPQCTEVVEGVCCPEVVNPANGAPVDTYLELVGQAAADCRYPCPAVPCVDEPTGVCVPGRNGGGGCQIEND